MKRALVLSGGGLFGAWQVGAWDVLRRHVDFDVVIGVSIGSLNGWAIAGGATAEELAAKWLRAAELGRLRFRFPRRPLDGVIEFTQIEGFIRDIHGSYQPRIEYHAVLTDLLRWQGRMVEGSQMHWRHLAASCALLGVLPQQRIDQVLYSDGGIIAALPLWAASQCRATHVIGLNAAPRMPWPVRALLKSARAFRHKPRKTPRENTFVLSPSRPLGGWREACSFDRARIAEWIAQGREDASAALRQGNISFLECFKA